MVLRDDTQGKESPTPPLHSSSTGSTSAPYGQKNLNEGCLGQVGRGAKLRSPSPCPCPGQLGCCPISPKPPRQQFGEKTATHHCWTSFSVTARENRRRLLALGGVLGDGQTPGSLLPALPSAPPQPARPCPPNEQSRSGAPCPATPAGDSTGLSLLRPIVLLEGLTRTAPYTRGWLSLLSWGAGGLEGASYPGQCLRYAAPHLSFPGQHRRRRHSAALPACGGPGQKG